MRKESWSAFCQKVDDEEPGGFLGNYGRDVSYIAVVEAFLCGLCATLSTELRIADRVPSLLGVSRDRV
jgi:hypothetical protein